MRLRLAAVLVLAFAIPARADTETETDKLARGMELRLPPHAREVDLVRGKTRISLYGNGRDLKVGVQVDVDRAHEQVKITFDGNCGGDDVQHYTYDELEAMLEADAAGALLKAKDAHDAAAGYAKAVALDPKNLGYPEHLALALMRDGQRRPEAVAALRTAMHDHPLEILTLILHEPDLVPLASEPELAALTAGPPGNFHGDVGYEPVHGWIVVRQVWGSTMAENAGGSRLEILDRTGAIVTALVDDKLVVALGFDDALAGTDGHIRTDDDPAPTSAHVAWSAKLDTAGLAVICSDKNVVRVLARNQILGERERTPCGGEPGSEPGVSLVPHAIVSVYRVVVGEGCGGETYSEYAITPLAQPGPPGMQALEAAATADRAARAGKLQDAIDAYTHSLALAPDRLEVSRRFAAVLARNHQVPEAIAALAKLPPVDRLFAIDVDPDLAPLAGAAEVVALHAAKPGTARDFTGYQAASHLVSFRVESGENSEWASGVVIVDQRTDKLVTQLPLMLVGEADQCSTFKDSCIKKASRAIIAARTAAAHRVLLDLGFDAPIESLTAKAQPAGNAAAWRATARGKTFEVACSPDGALTVTNGKTVTDAHPATCDRDARPSVLRFPGFVLVPNSGDQQIVPFR